MAIAPIISPPTAGRSHNGIEIDRADQSAAITANWKPIATKPQTMPSKANAGNSHREVIS